MALVKQSEIRLEGIARTLAESRLAVPRYQRSYMWQQEHVEELFADLRHAIESSQPDYFLGSIVIARGVYVVDGQQRLATVSILMAAIRDYLRARGDDARAKEIEARFLFQRELRDMQIRPRLSLNAIDNEYFEDRILDSPIAAGEDDKLPKPSHENLRVAAHVAADHVSGLVKKQVDPADELVRWVEFLEKGAQAIVFRVPEDADAFTIFETLNDRGLELATSDLLKNYLFGLAGDDRLAEVENRWAETVGTLAAVDQEGALVTFIRHSWSSKHGLTRERELYRRIKNRVRSRQEALQLGSELQQGAQLYASVLSPSSQSWQKLGGRVACRYMETLNDLGMKQLRPLLLAILENFPPPEIRAALNMLISAAVRLLIVGTLGGGTMEEHYSSAACHITNRKIRKAGGLRRALGPIIPTDAEFHDRFAVASVSRAVVARYYLRVLELVAKGEAEPALVPNPDSSKVNLEHVLPRNVSRDWAHFSAEDVASYANRIGNLVLMTKRMNSALKAASFARKSEVYKEQQLVLTSELADRYTEWTKETIYERQGRLADLAVQAWPFAHR